MYYSKMEYIMQKKENSIMKIQIIKKRIKFTINIVTGSSVSVLY